MEEKTEFDEREICQLISDILNSREVESLKTNVIACSCSSLNDLE